MYLVFLRGRTTLDSVKFSIFVFSLDYLGKRCRVNSDFALVLGAVGVEHLCPPYLGIRTQRARCKDTKCSADVTCDICKDWSVAQWEAFLKRRPYSERHKKCPSGSALPSAPPTLPPSTSASSEAGRPVPPPWSLTPPSEGCDHSGKMEGVPRVGSRKISPPPSRRLVGEDGGGGGGGLGFCGRERFSCFLPPALHVYLSRVVEIPVKSVAVPVHGLGGHLTSLANRAVSPRTVRSLVDEGALAVTRHAPLLPVCGLDDPGRGLLTATRTIECARDRLAVARPGVIACGRMGPATGHVTIAGLVTTLPFLLTARGHGRGVGGLDGVAGIAAALGRRWSLPLRLRLAPSLFPRPLSRTSPGCSSACLDPWHSGMWL